MDCIRKKKVSNVFTKNQIFGDSNILLIFVVYSIGRKDLKSINDFLDGKKFLLGDKPCNEDAALFGMLCQLVYHETGPMNQFIKSIFSSYITNLYFGDIVMYYNCFKLNVQIFYHTSKVSSQLIGPIGNDVFDVKKRRNKR